MNSCQFGVRSIVLSVVFLFTASADTLSIWNGGVGLYSNASQWTPAGVPNNSSGHTFVVSIGSGGTDQVTLDKDATVDSLTIGGGRGSAVLYSGFNLTTNDYPTLTVLDNVAIDSSGAVGQSGNGSLNGFADHLTAGGTVNNAGRLYLGNETHVGGDLLNSGTLVVYQNEPLEGFNVNVQGKLANSGSITFGSQAALDAGPTIGIGSLANTGSITLFTPVDVGAASVGYTNIPHSASWYLYSRLSVGSADPFAQLTSNQGVFETGISRTITPIGGTLNNQGLFDIHNPYSAGPNVAVVGTFSNSGTLLVQDEGSLTVTGSLINQAGGVFTVDALSDTGAHAQRLVNFGSIVMNNGNSSAQDLDNHASLNIQAGSLSTSSVKESSGAITLQGGSLLVGSGSAAAGFVGYQQFSDGVLYAAGGTIEVAEGFTLLDGTLDIMLGNGAKPVAAVFDILTGVPGTISGSFSDVKGLVFDGGRQSYVLNYDRVHGIVSLTVAGTPSPEPMSLLLLPVGLMGIRLLSFFRKTRSLPI